jgi:hypothetical protein
MYTYRWLSDLVNMNESSAQIIAKEKKDFFHRLRIY